MGSGPRQRCPPASEAGTMIDLASLGLTVAFFALSVAFVALCDRL
jgi:hypothetical protein